jgi:hypothetical protein
MYEMKEGRVPVKVGQVWQDNDPRRSGNPRFILVLHVNVDYYAFVVRCDQNGLTSPQNRKTSIRLSRFKPTRSGYILIRDVA